MIPLPKRLREVKGGAKSHTRSKHQERELADRITARVTRGSGNKMERGDVRLKGIVRIECKTTVKKSFSITRLMLAQIKSAAFSAGEIPAIVVEFLRADGKPMEEVAVVPTWVLEEIIKAKTKK